MCWTFMNVSVSGVARCLSLYWKDTIMSKSHINVFCVYQLPSDDSFFKLRNKPDIFSVCLSVMPRSRFVLCFIPFYLAHCLDVNYHATSPASLLAVWCKEDKCGVNNTFGLWYLYFLWKEGGLFEVVLVLPIYM